MAQYAILIYADDSAHSADASPEDLELRLDRRADASAAYAHALDLTQNEAERQFLMHRLQQTDRR